MNDDSEVIRLEVDPEDAIKGAAAGNAAMDAYSKKAETAVRAASKVFEEHGAVVVRVSDRSRGSIDRLVSAVEKQAAIYGKSGVDRLVAERDRLIQRLGNEEAAVRKVTAAYEKMIAAEASLAGESGGRAGMGGTGFRTTFAIKGIKDIAEGRGTFALAEAVNELMALRGTALVIGGITAGLAAAGVAAYEFKHKLEELHQTAERVGGRFSRFTDESKLSNDELQVTNDKLQNAIAKLEHRPQNGIKLAIDEAALSADRLAIKLDKSLRAFMDLSKENRPGGLSRFLFNEQDTKDIGELVGGKTGFGGLIGEVYGATSQGRDPGPILGKYRQKVATLLENAEHPAPISYANGVPGFIGTYSYTPNPEIFENRRQQLRALLTEIDSQARGYQLERENADLGKKAGGLEVSAGYRDRALEIEKRSREALEAAFLGNQTPMEKFTSELSKIALERQDELRTLPGQGGIIDAAARRNATASRLRLMSELREMTKRTDAELEASEGFGKGLTPDDPTGSLGYNYLKRLFDLQERQLRSAGILDARGGLSESITGQPTAPIPAGYVSPQQQLALARRQERGYLGLYGLRSDLAGVRPEAQAQGVYSARLGFAEQEYHAQLRIADAISETQKREEARVAALNELEEKRFDAQMEREQRLLEIDKQHFDQIKATSGGLYHTLFTNPRAFGGQFMGTLREAALHPVIDRLSTATAQLLTPLFSPGGGGINDVRLVGGAVPVHIVGAGGSGFAGGGSYSPIASASTGLMGGFSPIGGYSPMGAISSIVGGPGGTSGFAGPVSFGGGTAGGGLLGRVLPGLFGGKGGFSLGNLRGALGGLRHAPDYIDNGDGTLTPNPHAGRITGLTGLAAGAALAGGSMLAQYGLLGSERGTGGGIFMGLLGGAGIGFALGGPLGAAIGAGVGAAIGIGEMAAGVESPQRQAHRLIQSIYGVDIPERSGIMQQIVASAQQYGGSVGMAVRTPQVRELIELYAMSTGQKNSLFLTTPHAASLVQQNGGLYQGLSYFNGAGYNYASSLPTLGYSAGTIPTYNPYQGGGMNIQLDGPATTALLAGQVVKTASPGYVASRNLAALQSGDRFGQAAALTSPQTIFA